MKSTSFIHNNFPKKNKFRESVKVFDNLINAVVWCINTTFYGKEYDEDSKKIYEYVVSNYDLDDSDIHSLASGLCGILQINLIICLDRENIRYYGHPLCRTKPTILIYIYNKTFYPIISIDNKCIYNFDEIKFTLHYQGKIQSSLRGLRFSDLQHNAKELGLEFKESINGKMKNKSKLSLYEEIVFSLSSQNKSFKKNLPLSKK